MNSASDKHIAGKKPRHPDNSQHSPSIRPSETNESIRVNKTKPEENTSSKSEHASSSNPPPEIEKKESTLFRETIINSKPTDSKPSEAANDQECSDCLAALDLADSARLKGNKAYSSGRLYDAISTYTAADRHLSTASTLEQGYTEIFLLAVV